MEQYNQATVTSNVNLFELQIDQEVMGQLSTTAKWGKFLAIMGFISCAILVIVALFFAKTFAAFATFSGAGGSVYNETSLAGSFITIMYIVTAIVWFFPNFFLYKFSTKMQVALRNTDQLHLNGSFSNLRTSFRYIGILTIIVLSFFMLALIIAVSAAAFR